MITLTLKSAGQRSHFVVTALLSTAIVAGLLLRLPPKFDWSVLSNTNWINFSFPCWARFLRRCRTGSGHMKRMSARPLCLQMETGEAFGPCTDA